MKKLFAFILLAGWTNLCIAQKDSLPSFIKDSLDNYVTKALAQWQVPGAAVAIVKDGKTVWMKGYGVKEIGANDKVDENTLFMIGSNTKAFTATALAMLEADNLPAGKAGKLSLDDKVQKWLPDFKLYDPWVAKETTIRDLLCHRLGFETFQGDFMYFDSDLTIAEVREKMGKLKPLYGFRSKWGYTNAAFMTAGEIIPKVTGQSWASFVTERIFKPLGMNNSLALSKDKKTALNKCSAHTVVMGELKKIPYGNIDNLAPAGSISSSVNDMSRWVIAQLNNGKLDGKEVITATAIAQTRTPNSILGNGGHMFNKSHFSLYGLGWFIEEYAGRKIVEHTGGVNGFVTSVCLVPEERLGIIVFTNTDANNFYQALRNEIEDAYLGLPYRNYSKVYLERTNNHKQQEAEWLRKKKDTIAMAVDTFPVSAYTGTYKHNVYGQMTIALEKNKLVARFEHHKGRYATLELLGPGRFLATFNDPLYGIKEWDFTISKRQIRSVTVSVADFVEFLPYEFYKVK